MTILEDGTTVVNILAGEEFDVRIDRWSKWGNPYSHKRGTRAKWVVPTKEAAIEAYRGWIATQPELLAALGELAGKRLGCNCKPGPCHGDILMELLQAVREKRKPT